MLNVIKLISRYVDYFFLFLYRFFYYPYLPNVVNIINSIIMAMNTTMITRNFDDLHEQRSFFLSPNRGVVSMFSSPLFILLTALTPK